MVSRVCYFLKRCNTATLIRSYSSQSDKWIYETLAVSTPTLYVAHVELNRPEKGNAMNAAFWREMVGCFSTLSGDSNIRAIVISGSGKLFSGGLDLSSMVQDQPEFFVAEDPARRARRICSTLQNYQKSFTQIELCPQPVIAAVHSACVGAGLDLISACDIRFCSMDAYFQVKEVDIGGAADLGTLQRLPKACGNSSFLREISYTARKVYSQEAMQHGIVSRILNDRQSCIDAALSTAAVIAEKSPVAVQTTKQAFNYARDHSVSGLYQMQLLNQCMLQSEDLPKAAQAAMNKEQAVFDKL